jgi:hypothetical protein
VDAGYGEEDHVARPAERERMPRKIFINKKNAANCKCGRLKSVAGVRVDAGYREGDHVTRPAEREKMPRKISNKKKCAKL